MPCCPCLSAVGRAQLPCGNVAAAGRAQLPRRQENVISVSLSAAAIVDGGDGSAARRFSRELSAIIRPPEDKVGGWDPVMDLSGSRSDGLEDSVSKLWSLMWTIFSLLVGGKERRSGRGDALPIWSLALTLPSPGGLSVRGDCFACERLAEDPLAPRNQSAKWGVVSMRSQHGVGPRCRAVTALYRSRL